MILLLKMEPQISVYAVINYLFIHKWPSVAQGFEQWALKGSGLSPTDRRTWHPRTGLASHHQGQIFIQFY